MRATANRHEGSAWLAGTERPVRLGYRHDLDGLRALAVLAVMYFHSHPFLPGFEYMGGFLGVDVFFVLSGYLITTLLLNEAVSTGRIHIGAFYARRAIRLLPAFAVLLVGGGVVALVIGGNVGPRSYPQAALMAVTYLGNWFQAEATLGLLAHTWSLAIEEQYYLVWPALFVLGRRHIRSSGRIALVLFVVAVGIAGLRYGVFLSGRHTLAALSTFTRADGVVLGSALALALAADPKWLRRILAFRLTPIVAGGCVFGISLVVEWDSPSLFLGGLFAANLGTAVLIGHLVVREGSATSRVLSLGPLPWIGRISYGLYLFHVPINHLLHRPPLDWDGPLSVVAMFVATFVFAAGSFVVIERRALRLKGRFTRRPTERSPAPASER